MESKTPAGLKACSKCRQDKPLAHFSKQSRSKDGKQAHCKPCHNASMAANYAANGDRYKLYRSQHRDEKREYNTAYRAANVDRIREQERVYHAENRNVSWESQYRRRAAHVRECSAVLPFLQCSQVKFNHSENRRK